MSLTAPRRSKSQAIQLTHYVPGGTLNAESLMMVGGPPLLEMDASILDTVFTSLRQRHPSGLIDVDDSHVAPNLRVWAHEGRR